MRIFCVAAISLIALAACSKPAEPVAPSAPAAEAPAADAHAGHDMTAMDETMAASDTADDAAAVVTPDGHTFHTYPNKIEIVHLPMAEGGVWTAQGFAPSDLFAVLESKDDKLADGTPVHSVRFETKASGNGKVVFERRASDNPNDGVLEVRTVNFMIH
jgi:hypothetical protein